MHRNLPLYLCPNTELLLSDAHPHDQIKSPQSSPDLRLMCLFLDLYYNGNKIMINNDPRSHYLVALIRISQSICKLFAQGVAPTVMYTHRRITSVN